MSNSINLLGNKTDNKTLSKVFTKITILRYTSIGLLFIVSASSVILFILISISPLPTLQDQEKAAGLALEQQQTDIAKIALVNDRAKDISEILTKRQSFDTTIDLVRSKMPKGLTVTSFMITRNNISLTVSSKSLSLLDQFINNLLKAADEKKDFSRVTLADLSIERDVFLLKLTITTL